MMSNAEKTRLAIVEQGLIRVWREVLKTDQIDVNQSIFALGGDSISSLLIAAKALTVGIRITALQVLEKETVARLAEVAELTEEALEEVKGNDEEMDAAVGEVKLTPIQHWFFEQDIPDINYWYMATFVDVQRKLSEEVLYQALIRIIEHHDALRSKFSCRDGKWVQFISQDVGELWLNVIDTRTLDRRRRLERIQQASSESHARIDIARGSLVAAVLVRTADAFPDQLLLMVHHLVVDSVSMRILMQDLEAACCMLAAGEDLALPTKTVSMRSWSRQLAHYSMSPPVLDHLDYWRAVPSAEFAPVYSVGQRDLLARKNTFDRTGTVSVKVPSHIVSELTGAGYRVAGATLQDALLTGFLLAWQEQADLTALQLDLESHGREPLDRPVDVTKTVGWFTAIYPAVLEIPGSDNKIDALRAVHQHLASIPGKGMSYGLLRYLSGPEGSVLARLEQSQVSFNYLGWFDGPDEDRLFSPPMRVPVPLQDPKAPRRYLLDIVISGTRGAVDVDVIYATDFFPERSVRALADRYQTMLGELSLTLAEYRN